jgi:hypothetical protein
VGVVGWTCVGGRGCVWVWLGGRGWVDVGGWVGVGVSSSPAP